MKKLKPWDSNSEMRKQVKILRKKGRKLYEICEELGVTISFVRNNLYKDTRKAAVKRYYLKNREKIINQMKEYHLKRQPKK